MLCIYISSLAAMYIEYTYIHSGDFAPFLHTFIRTYIHTFIHTHIHTYIHTYIHVYIHTYIHTYIVSPEQYVPASGGHAGCGTRSTVRGGTPHPVLCCLHFPAVRSRSAAPSERIRALPVAPPAMGADSSYVRTWLSTGVGERTAARCALGPFGRGILSVLTTHIALLSLHRPVCAMHLYPTSPDRSRTRLRSRAPAAAAGDM